MSWALLSDVVGIIGVVLVLIAYYLLQANRLTASNTRYLQMNVIGSLLILFSLFFNWNTSAVLIEIMWFLISLWGMIKSNKTHSSALV